jgi:hypothetical protein
MTHLRLSFKVNLIQAICLTLIFNFVYIFCLHFCRLFIYHFYIESQVIYN